MAIFACRCCFCWSCRFRRCLVAVLPSCLSKHLGISGKQRRLRSDRDSYQSSWDIEQQRDVHAETDRDADEDQIICGEQWDVWFGPEDTDG